MEYPTRLHSQSDNFKIFKDEMDSLRLSVEKEYRARGGQKKLGNATVKIYKELAKNISDKLKEEKILLSYKESNEEQRDIQEPGYTFLKDLFYTFKNAAEMNCRQYNIDLLYVYIYGLNRFDYNKSRAQEIQQKDKKLVDAQKRRIKVIISSNRGSMIEVESLKNYLETQFGCEIEKHWIENNGIPLSTLYKDESKKDLSKMPIIFHLIGLNYFRDKGCTNQIIDAIKKHPSDFKKRSVIICLKDICDSDINIHSYSGKYKISEYWNEELKFISGSYVSNTSTKATGEVLKVKKQENSDIQGLKALIIDILDILNFIDNETGFIQFDHFLNYLMLDDLNKMFRKRFPSEFN